MPGNHASLGLGVEPSYGITTVAKEIIKNIDEDSIVYLSYDSYYRDHSNLNPQERSKINFGHLSRK